MPVLDVLWSMFWLFLFIAWIGVVINVIADIFRNPEMNGFNKAAWTLAVILLPWLGVLFYLLSNGDGMATRQERGMASNDRADSYVQQMAGTSPSPATELSLLVDLRDSGAISDQDFEAQKAKVLG